MMSYRLLLVQPGRLSREGFRQLLGGASTMLQDVASAHGFLDSESPAAPDVVIWGPGLPMKVLCSEIAAVRARFSQEAEPIRHVVLTNDFSAKFIRQVAMLDVEALLDDNISAEIFLRSIELVMLGQRLFPVLRHREHAAQRAEIVPFPRTALTLGGGPIARKPSKVMLSSRESEILKRLVEGASNKAIALELHSTEATVKVHVRALLRKMQATNRTQAAMWALQHQYGVSDGSRSLQVVSKA